MPAASDDLDPRRWRALAVCLCALGMTLLDVSIVSVALPSMATGLNAGPAELQWVVSGYVLTFGMVPIIAGRLGDDRGRRRMLLIGIASFVVTSAAVGFAPTTGVVIAARALQGVAGGLINPQVSGLVQQLFPRAERARAFGYIGAIVGVATATGPVIGGTIIAIGGADLGWRLCFLVNLPVGVFAFVACQRLLPATPPRTRPPRPLDLRGAGLLTSGMFFVLFPAVQYDSGHNLWLALLWIPAAGLLIGFLLWERGPARRIGHPLIDYALFKIRSYSDGLGIALLYLSGYSGLPLVLALFLQQGLGYSALTSGLTASSFAIGSGIGAMVAGRMLNRLGRPLLIGALAIFIVGATAAILTVWFTAGSVSTSAVAWVLAPTLFVAGVGGGGVITPNQALSLSEIDARGGSTAGGMLQTAQRIGAAIGSAALSAVFYAQVSGYTRTTGRDRVEHYSHAYAAAVFAGLLFVAAAFLLAIREVQHARATALRQAASGPVTEGR